MWREALSCASITGTSSGNVQYLARQLAADLEESKDYASAAIICEDYLKDNARATYLLCKAYQFAEAIRLVGLHGEPELFATVIDPGLVEGFNSTIELFADCKKQLGEQIPRLRELRLKKRDEPRKFLGSATSSLLTFR